MESSESECFESADEDFELETKQPTEISKNSVELEEFEPKKEATHCKHKDDSDIPDKSDRRKRKPKLGTKMVKSGVGGSVPKLVNKRLDELKPVGNNIDVSKSWDEPEPNLWDDDDWGTTNSSVAVEQNQDKEVLPQRNQSTSNINNDIGTWSSWGNWGVSSLLSTASSITTQVSQGLTTVLESGIGAPDPAILAKLDKSEETVDQPSETKFGIGNLISGVTQITKLVETTGTKVISGGLDTLETIGKKTMEVLQEGDPGFKKKRAFLKIEGDKPVLSQILREAKDKAEEDNRILEQKHYSKKANYELLFDDHQGLVHLEALEILSKQCDIKLQTILESKSGSDLVEMQETMAQIKELCELNEDDEEDLFNFEEVRDQLRSHVSEMNITVSYDKLISTWLEAESWFRNLNLSVCNEMELYEQAIDTLAQLTAISVEQFHKTGELLLVKEHRSTVDEADSLVQLTTLLTNLMCYVAKILSNKLHEKLPSCKNQDNINKFITNIYFEAANSSSYIKNAFQLLVPVLQVGAI